MTVEEVMVEDNLTEITITTEEMAMVVAEETEEAIMIQIQTLVIVDLMDQIPVIGVEEEEEGMILLS